MDKSKKLVLSGVIWSGLQMVINQGFGFIIRLVLAKLLFPEEFGIVGMATVMIGFVQVLNDLGIGAALVQKKDESLTEKHYHTSFWTGIIWSSSLYLLLSLVVAPLAADFYREDMLNSLIPVISLGMLLSPVNLVHKAQLIKAMNFKKIAFIDNVANIAAGTLALALAFLNAGVWSLAFNLVATTLVSMPLYFRATKWLPKFMWDKKAFNEIFGFGVYTTGTNVINYLMNNIDYLLIGKLLNASLLGAYTFAFVLTDTFRNRLMAIINNVMYPLYGKKQEDPEALKKYYLKVVNYNSVLVYPIMVIMFTYAEPIILVFFGNKWVDSIEPLKLLSLSVMVHMMVNSNTALIRGVGRPKLEMQLQAIKAAILVPMLFIGVSYYGIVGAAWVILINKVIAVLIAQYTFNRLLPTKVSTLEFLNAIKNPWIASFFAFIIGNITYRHFEIHFIMSGLILLITYLTLIWALMGSELKMQFYQFKLSKR